PLHRVIERPEFWATFDFALDPSPRKSSAEKERGRRAQRAAGGDDKSPFNDSENESDSQGDQRPGDEQYAGQNVSSDDEYWSPRTKLTNPLKKRVEIVLNRQKKGQAGCHANEQEKCD